MNKRFLRIAREIGKTVEEKNAAYGSSFETAGVALTLLYPRGVPVDQLDDMLLLARIWDKMMRIATDRDAFGEDPFRDIAGYAILGVAVRQQGKELRDAA